MIKGWKVDVNTKDYDVKIVILRKATERFVPEALPEIAEYIAARIRIIIPVKTGRLRASVTVIVHAMEAIIMTTAGYGLYVDLPTRPHIIQARTRKYLRWFGADGRPRFAKQVRHPGTRGAYFRRRALDASRGGIVNILQRTYNSLVGNG